MATLRIPVYQDDIDALIAVIETAADASVPTNQQVNHEQYVGKAQRFAAIVQQVYDERKENHATPAE